MANLKKMKIKKGKITHKYKYLQPSYLQNIEGTVQKQYILCGGEKLYIQVASRFKPLTVKQNYIHFVNALIIFHRSEFKFTQYHQLRIFMGFFLHVKDI